jgi:hypothetical protein
MSADTGRYQGQALVCFQVRACNLSDYGPDQRISMQH